MKVCECSWTSEVVTLDTLCNMNLSVQVSHRSVDAQRLLVITTAKHNITAEWHAHVQIFLGYVFSECITNIYFNLYWYIQDPTRPAV